MQINISVDESDIKLAVCEWLLKYHKITVKQQELEEITVADSDYDSTNTRTIGYKVNSNTLNVVNKESSKK